MKPCSKCRTLKPLEEFYRHGVTIDGYDSWCKCCRRAYQSRYKEYKRLYQAEYHKRRPEVWQAWKEQNREHLRAVYRRRYQEDPRYRLRLRVLKARRRAQKKHQFGNVTAQEWAALKQNHGNACYTCGRREPDIKLTLDHSVPLSRGGPHAIDNIKPLCLTCNLRKGTQGPEWYKEQLTKSQFEE